MSNVPQVLKGVVTKAVTIVVPHMGELVDPEEKDWTALLDRPVETIETNVL